MLKFFAKFILFNLVTFIFWFLFHSYYEAILWFFTIKTSQIFGPLPLTNPETINGEFICRLGKVTTHFTFPSLFVAIFITIPLLLSTSGISLSNKIQMTMMGLFFVFLFQILFILIAISFQYYYNYPDLLQKVIAYSRAKYLIFLWLDHFFKCFFQFPVAVGIWIGLVSYYKRSVKQGWIQKLF